MYPRRVFNVFFLLFRTYRKPRCLEQTAIDALISANHLSQSTRATSPSNVIRISTRKRFKVFRYPRNFIRKSEPAVEHRKSPASNANPEVKYPKTTA